MKQMIDREQKFRITPACAGKSVSATVSLNGTEDHPCVCREKALNTRANTAYHGSPLRVQGKDQFRGDISLFQDITPACAGKRPLNFSAVAMTEDHPCVCREKVAKKAGTLHDTGSPLRVQGKVCY